MFSYLALGPHRLDEDTQNILLSRRQLARMMEIHPKKMNGSAFLKTFKQDVLPGLVWSGYSAEGGKCRAILKTGIDEFLQAHLWEDEEKERVYFLEQKSYNRANEQERYKATKDMHQTLYAHMGNKDQRLIAGYLHNLPYTYFKRLVTSHYREAKQVIETLECTENDRTNLRQSLYALRDFPMPFYHLSGDNMRLYSDGGLPMMKKEIRKVFSQGLIELDLVSCQCAIAAGIWNIDSINYVLQRGGSYWDAILTYMQVPEKLRSLVKPILKEATYSLMYGKKASHVEGYVTRGFKGYAGKNNRVYNQGVVSIPKARKFTSCPLIKGIISAREQAVEDIKRDGWYMSAYGPIQFNPDEDDIGSFLCIIIQSYELSIIASVFELAMMHSTDFRVVLYQYDGLTIDVLRKDRRAPIIANIQEVAKKKALSMGIYTTLEE